MQIRPKYYKSGNMEPFDIIDAYDLDFYLGNAIKYICRAGKKDVTKTVEDLEKANTYIQCEIDRLIGKEYVAEDIVNATNDIIKKDLATNLKQIKLGGQNND